MDLVPVVVNMTIIYSFESICIIRRPERSEPGGLGGAHEKRDTKAAQRIPLVTITGALSSLY